MKLADSHLHLFKNGYRGIYGRSLLRHEVDAYEQLRAVHDIERGLVVGYQGEGIDPENNFFVRSLVAEHPWMATVAHIDARAAPTAHSVSRLINDGHAGIALYIEDAPAAKALTSWSIPGWRALNERRAIISLNVALEFISVFTSFARDNPGCAFLVSHIGMPGSYKTPPSHAEAADRLAPLLHLSAIQNVFVKISGLYAISDPASDYPHRAAEPFVRIALERFGPHRCVWGSDFSPALDHVSFAQTISNPWLDGLDEGDRAKVMGENLVALLEQARTYA
jgi:predicted TIM-barrel fold metal-dependent hydrolase